MSENVSLPKALETLEEGDRFYFDWDGLSGDVGLQYKDVYTSYTDLRFDNIRFVVLRSKYLYIAYTDEMSLPDDMDDVAFSFQHVVVTPDNFEEGEDSIVLSIEGSQITEGFEQARKKVHSGYETWNGGYLGFDTEGGREI